ncbi:uncharacterized protein DUF4276 [Mesonia algae]|uniref:Uncharacterized protein DUF4276 n=1 Tax=Mesonia algae TaxID=213248 RepID=A0A2W7IPN3_9FLAO|nr:DUF4276 family protein [Mesonia algae]PZW40613.1 uncharacterized protein DUF4276 [Mesonia algae]
MKRVHCIVEGQTEVRVFYSILVPYIYEKTGVHMTVTPINHTKGGMVQFSKIFTELRNHLSEKGKIVTTFFDYYGILPIHNFRYYAEAKLNQSNAALGAEILEKGMNDYISDLGTNTRYFIPYIQVHEFEALLFSSDEGFDFKYDDIRILRELKNVRNRYPNPEDINDSPHTSPSKRLEKILNKYKDIYVKTNDGEDIATIIGIETILDQCPRFSAWVENLIFKINE